MNQNFGKQKTKLINSEMKMVKKGINILEDISEYLTESTTQTM